MKKRMRSLQSTRPWLRGCLIWLLLVLLLLSATGCAGTPTGRESREAERSTDLPLRKSILVLDWTPNTNHSGVYVALEKGYYREEGIALEIEQPPEDGAEALVAAGRADFGVSFQDYLAPALAGSQPLPLLAVAALVNHNSSGIVALASSGIGRPAELEGRRYATWDLPVERAMMENVIRADGGDPGRVEWIPTTVSDIVTSLETLVDAVWIFYAWDGIALDVKGIDHSYFAFADINPVFDYYTPVLITNEERLRQEPDFVRAFLRATRRGYEDAIRDPEEAAEILLRHAPELDPELVRASQVWLSDRYIADAPRWGWIEAERWDAFYAWLAEEGLIARQLPPGAGFSNDYLPE
ncbi:MAG: ABC transporter substrate-binding protein [Bacillota bacterium]|nr:ABC transporter substrate-binding protein [Bacillota bacterium]